MAIGRGSAAAGNLKIQQRHNRTGTTVMFVILPSAAMEWMGWEPGMYLTYYPTKAHELVLVAQDQMLLHVSPDYDPASMRELRSKIKPPREGSIAEAEVSRERERQQWLAKLGDPFAKAELAGDEEGEEENSANDDAAPPSSTPRRSRRDRDRPPHQRRPSAKKPGRRR